MATDFQSSKHSCFAFPEVRDEVSSSAVYSVSMFELPPMLSQCLGSSLLGAKRRCTEKDREKGTLNMQETTRHQGMLQSLENGR